MELVEDDFGWQKDVDAEGKEFCHPDITAVATYMEMLSHGIIPELEWKSPGRRQQPTNSNIPSRNRLESALPSKPLLPETNNRAQPPKPNPPTLLSAFDFDDSDMYDASAEASSSPAASLLKVEPRKRVVATLDSALQAIHGAAATSKPETTSPDVTESPAKKQKTESGLEEAEVSEATPQTSELSNEPGTVAGSSAVVDVPNQETHLI